MLFETKEKAQNEWEALMFIKELIFGLNQKNITQSINLITKFDKTYSLSFNMIVSQLIYQVLVIKMNDYDLYLNFIKEIEVFEENNQTKSKILDVFTKHLLSKVTCDSSYLLNKMIENNFVSPKIVQKCISSCFAHYMTKEEIEKYNKIRFMKKIIENYEELSKNDWELHKKYVKEGVNPNEIAKIIRNDDIKKLQEISSQTNFNIDQIIEPSPYERCNFINEDLHLMYDDFTLIDYAAFFGSVKCFKYLLVNGADVYNTGRCAVAGGNLEIIHLCEKNHSSFVGAYETAIMFHRNDIFKYIYEKKLEIKYYKLEELAIFCILYHNYEIFLFLIENGMKINNNIINESAKNGNMLLTLYLIKKNFIPKDILVYSSKSGNIELMKYFLGKEGINVNTHCDEENEETALINASWYGYTEIAKLLLEQEGIDVNAKNGSGETALMNASSKGHFGIVKLLLEQEGIDINTKNNWGYTAFIWASLAGHTETVKLLLEQEGIDINAKGDDGWTALLLASASCYIEIIKLLLKQKEIEVNARDYDGKTVLIWAVTKGDIEIVKLLLEKEGIDVNAQDKDGQTALIIASIKGYIEIFELLFKHKEIDVNAKDEDGQTALMIASEFEGVEMIQLLLKKEEIDVNAQDKKGQTALMIASENGNIESVKLLLEQKEINLCVEDDNGETALGLASKYNYTEIVKLINENMT